MAYLRTVTFSGYTINLDINEVTDCIELNLSTGFHSSDTESSVFSPPFNISQFYHAYCASDIEFGTMMVYTLPLSTI